MYMEAAEEHVYRVIGRKTAAWFPEANKYVLADPRVIEAARAISAGEESKDVIACCIERLGFSRSDAARLCDAARKLIPEPPDERPGPGHETVDTFISERSDSPPFSEKNYSISSRVLKVIYTSAQAEFAIHPRFAHLETGPAHRPHHYLEIHHHRGRYALRVDGRPAGMWPEEQEHVFTGRFCMKLLEMAYGKREREWMAVLHAAGISDGKRALVFAGDSGTGKSTLAAIMLAHGFDVLADDFLPLEGKAGLLCRFPGAVSIKKEALGLLSPRFPELQSHLEGLLLLNRRRNRAILQQMNEISVLLHGQGIRPVFLKGGAHLADGLYADHGERVMGDIDFLVEKENYLRAAGVLMDSGYENPVEVYWEVSRSKHFYPLCRSDRPASVDVHQTPVGLKSARYFSTDMVFSRMRQVDGRINCYVPCDEHMILHNFIHSQITNGGWRFKQTSLKDIYDLYLLAQRVKPETVLPQIRETERARGYFIFSGRVLGREHEFCSAGGRKAERHCRLSGLALKHPEISKAYRKLFLLTALIFKTYLGSILKAVYRSETRKYLKSRLTTPGWYKSHLAGLKEKFFG